MDQSRQLSKEALRSVSPNRCSKPLSDDDPHSRTVAFCSADQQIECRRREPTTMLFDVADVAIRPEKSFPIASTVCSRHRRPCRKLASLCHRLRLTAPHLAERKASQMGKGGGNSPREARARSEANIDLHGQTGTPLRSAASQYLTPVLGAHALPESMLTFPFEV